jgi:hypothetical protein
MWNDLGVLLHRGSIDVFAVTESKVDSGISDSELSINRYRLVRRDRNRHDGGIAVYIKDKFQLKNVQQHENIEVLKRQAQDGSKSAQ